MSDTPSADFTQETAAETVYEAPAAPAEAVVRVDRNRNRAVRAVVEQANKLAAETVDAVAARSEEAAETMQQAATKEAETVDAVTARTEEATEAMQETAETVQQAAAEEAETATDSIKDFTAACQAIAQRNAERFSASIRVLAAAKTPAEFLALQRDIVTNNINVALDDTGRLASLTAAAFTAALQPVRQLLR